MNKDTYTYLLDNPQNLSDEQLEELQQVISAYPYFQSARALQLKALKRRNSFQYNDALKKTAAYTTERDILFEYITSDDFVQDDISRHIKQHDASINEIEVEAEDVSAAISLELESRMKAEIKKAEAILNPELFERKVSSVKELAREEQTEAEAELSPDAPLEFRKEDVHSFSEWLKLTSAKPIERDDTPQHQPIEGEKARKFELIDRFIQEKPKIKPRESTDQSNLALPFTETPETLMTETLAKVYVAQKNYKKALQAYHILILKYPEKSGFFADQIRAIKKLINKEDS